jgi:hypothetical protein
MTLLSLSMIQFDALLEAVCMQMRCTRPAGRKRIQDCIGHCMCVARACA